jgi:hypothetical protein
MGEQTNNPPFILRRRLYCEACAVRAIQRGELREWFQPRPADDTFKCDCCTNKASLCVLLPYPEAMQLQAHIDVLQAAVASLVAQVSMARLGIEYTVAILDGAISGDRRPVFIGADYVTLDRGIALKTLASLQGLLNSLSSPDSPPGTPH